MQLSEVEDILKSDVMLNGEVNQSLEMEISYVGPPELNCSVFLDPFRFWIHGE